MIRRTSTIFYAFIWLAHIVIFCLAVISDFFPQFGIAFLQIVFISILWIKAIHEFWVFFVSKDLALNVRLIQGIAFAILAVLVGVNSNIRLVSLRTIIIGILLIDSCVKLVVAWQYRQSGLSDWWQPLLAEIINCMSALALLPIMVISIVFIRIFALIVCWQTILSCCDLWRHEVYGQHLKRFTKLNVLFFRSNSYDTSFLPARWFRKIELELKKQNDMSRFLTEVHYVKKNISLAAETITVIIHSWNGDLLTMKGHVDIVIDGFSYSYGNYDTSSHLLNGNISAGVMVVAQASAYERYCLEQEKKVLLKYTLCISQKQKQKVITYIQTLKNNSVLWVPTSKANDETLDDAARLAATVDNVNFYKFKSGYFKYYFVLNTNCVRFVESLLGALKINELAPQGLLTPGDYIDFFEHKLYDEQDEIVVEREVLTTLHTSQLV